MVRQHPDQPSLGMRVPPWVAERLDRATAYALARRAHHRHLATIDPEIHEFAVPPGEHVAIPAVFTVELFPPSEAASLQKSLHRLRRRDSRHLLRGDHCVSAPFGIWWTLGSYSATSSRPGPGVESIRMPAEFVAVDLDAVRIGEGFCAILATFHTTDAARRRVDEVWHRQHRPEVGRHRSSGWPQAETAELTALRHTQLARQSLHHAARRWLRQTCPGFFAAHDEPHPLIDLMLFTRRDASSSHLLGHAEQAAYRALGLSESGVTQTSPALPAMNLEKVSTATGCHLDPARTWALWGQRQAIIDQAPSGLAWADDIDDRAIAGHAGHAVQDHLLRLSISEQLSVYLARYADIRDHAHRRRGLRIKHIEAQRTNLMGLSLNVSTVDRAVTGFNANAQRLPHHASFHVGSQPQIDAAEQLASDHTEMLDQLKAADEQYRSLVTMAASLTSAMQALRASRIARWIAATSLVVSTLLLALADTAQTPRIASLVQWLSGQL